MSGCTDCISGCAQQLLDSTHSNFNLLTACKVILDFLLQEEEKKITNLSEDQIEALELVRNGKIDDIHEDVKDSMVQTYREALARQDETTRVFAPPSIAIALQTLNREKSSNLIYHGRTQIPTPDELNIIVGLLQVNLLFYLSRGNR